MSVFVVAFQPGSAGIALQLPREKDLAVLLRSLIGDTATKPLSLPVLEPKSEPYAPITLHRVRPFGQANSYALL